MTSRSGGDQDTLAWLVGKQLIRREPGERAIRDGLVYGSSGGYYKGLGRLLLTNIRIVSLANTVKVDAKAKAPLFGALDLPLVAIAAVDAIPPRSFLLWKRLPGLVIRTTHGKKLRFYTANATAWISDISNQLREP
jgi:hypothetical protein